MLRVRMQDPFLIFQCATTIIFYAAIIFYCAPTIIFYTANIFKGPTALFFSILLLYSSVPPLLFSTLWGKEKKYVRLRLYIFYYYPHRLLNSGKSYSLSTLFLSGGGGMQYLQDNSELVAANGKQGCSLQDCNGHGPETRQAAYVQSWA